MMFTNPEIGIIQLASFIVIILLGFPIAFTLVAMGIFFGYYAMGPRIFNLLVTIFRCCAEAGSFRQYLRITQTFFHFIGRALLLSTTDEYCLLQPLRDRMKLVLRFQFYAEDELTTLLRQRSRALNWSVDEAVFPLIAQRSRGTPRLALPRTSHGPSNSV